METTKDCHHPWTWMMVSADANVRPCCWAPGILGNLHQASPEAIWNGELAQELRKTILADQIHPICANSPCAYVQNSSKKFPILKSEQMQSMQISDEDQIAAYKIFLGKVPQKDKLNFGEKKTADQLLVEYLMSDEFAARSEVAQLIFNSAKKILDRIKIAEASKPENKVS